MSKDLKPLFLDDERMPAGDPSAWLIARTVAQAVRFIKANGLPCMISFDNDLGGRLEGRHLAQWLIRVDVESRGRFIPDDFRFVVHSQNCVNGIAQSLDSYLKRRPGLFVERKRSP